jgi:hypothetical protein
VKRAGRDFLDKGQMPPIKVRNRTKVAAEVWKNSTVLADNASPGTKTNN